MKKLFTKEGFEIWFEALEEHQAIEDLGFGTYGVDSRTIKAVNAGDYAYFTAHVIAKKNGIALADDYLGSCIYDTEEEFTEAKGDYFEQMVDTVIAEAKANIKSLCEA